MRQMVRLLGAFVRDIGSGLDAGNAIRLGLSVPERARRHPSDPPELPWTEAGPAQPGRLYPWTDSEWWKRI